MFDRHKFFAMYTQKSCFGPLKPQSHANLNAMLNNLEHYSALFSPSVLLEQMAYISAIVHHESYDNRHWVRYGATREQKAMSAQTALKSLQDRYWSSGYYGRGVIHIIWYNNYVWAEQVSGQPLVEQPDLLLYDLNLSYEVAIKGMVMGIFTGVSLDNTIDKKELFTNNKKILHGDARAQLLLKYARMFLKLFKETWHVSE